MDPGDVIFREHAARRMLERDINHRHVIQTLRHGEIIERYPEDQPYGSALYLGWVWKAQAPPILSTLPAGGKLDPSTVAPIHVVAAEDMDGIIYVITCYWPDSDKWAPDFRTRR